MNFKIKKLFKLIIGIVGKISVGKSSIAKELSQRTNILNTSFGSYLVNYSKENNLPLDRKSLQSLGEKFIENDSMLFLEAVLNNKSDQRKEIILEGIRHFVIREKLDLLSGKVVLIYINASQETRFTRYINRHKEGDQEYTLDSFLKIDNHVVEMEIEKLMPYCNLVVNSDELNPKQIVNIIISFLNEIKPQ